MTTVISSGRGNEKRVYITVPFAYHAIKMKQEISDIFICEMTEDDLDAVLGIEAVSFPHPWNKTHFLQELQSSYAFPLVALSSDGTLAGYICPMLLLDEGHILDVAVHPDYRGQGIGRLLVERVITDCRAGGAEFISLEVRPSNLSAINLYERLGFIRIGQRKRYYQDGEDAILMELIFKGSEEQDNAV